MDDPLRRSVDVVRRFITGTGDLRDTLEQLVTLTASALGADMAGVTIHDHLGRPTTEVFTKGMVVEIDEAQYGSDRGPVAYDRPRRRHRGRRPMAGVREGGLDQRCAQQPLAPDRGGA